MLTNDQKIVLFETGDELFGIDISKVKEVVKISGYTKIPGAPSFLEGIINLRGSVVGVIHLNRKLGFEIKEDNIDSRIIVVEIENKLVGMRVDKVREVITIDIKSKKPTPPVIASKINEAFINGIIILDGKIVILANIERIISLDEFNQLKNIIKDGNPSQKSDLEDKNGGL